MNNSIFPELKLTKGIVEVSLCHLDEGHNGYYDPADPDDERLLRFDISRWNGEYMEAVDDSSYCTLIPINTLETHLLKVLHFILVEVYHQVCEEHSIKRLCERLSWITVNQFGEVTV